MLLVCDIMHSTQNKYFEGLGVKSMMTGDVMKKNPLFAVLFSATITLFLIPANSVLALEPLFDSSLTYDAGNSPYSVCAGDLDGDGDLDLVVANYYDNNVSVLFNNGDGTYAAAVNYGVGNRPCSVCAGDLDGDNDLDLAVANISLDNVSVLLNNGDGTYAAAVNYNTDDGAISVCAGDLDGDGDLDLAVANTYHYNVSVLLNNGDGTYAAAVDYTTGADPISVCAGDLDGDNDLDLAVANYWDNNISVLLNNGDGAYAAAVNYGAGDYPISVCAGDLDGDNDLDLAVANSESDNVSVLLNLSDRPIIPNIRSIIDIPNDQGRQVRISWDRVCFDETGGTVTVTEYAVYRKIDYTLTSYQEFSDNKEYDEISSKIEEREELYYPPGDWDYTVSVPARAEHEYSVVVPTFADSTISDGIYYSTFFVSALTSTPWIYFDSAPDSGYSVDNLTPGVPEGFSVAYNSESGNDLSWEESEEEDFKYYRIYRSEGEGFEPGPENMVHSTADPHWLDTVVEGWKYHYKITALDFSGNESAPAAPDVITGTEAPDVPAAFALHQNYPNPFNPVTTIRFDLPASIRVALSVYNAKGEKVRMLLDKEMTAGQKSVDWNGRSDEGRAVASGVYFYCLKAGEFEETRKMILMR